MSAESDGGAIGFQASKEDVERLRDLFGGRPRQPEKELTLLEAFKKNRERLQSRLDHTNKIIAMIEEHPEFVDFVKMLQKEVS